MGGVVLRDFADNHACKKAGHYGKGHLPPVGETEEVEHAEGYHGYENGSEVGATAEGAKEVLKRGAFLGAHHVNA